MKKVHSGLIKKVLSEEQFNMINSNKINSKDITIIDTIQTFTNKEGNEVEYLPFRLSTREIDRSGNEKFIFDDEKNEYIPSFSSTNVLYAYGKELRIILELGEHHPIKVVFDENEGSKINKVICVQDQSTGTLV